MDKKLKMQKTSNYLNPKASATTITSLIFLFSLPFLILLALPSILFRDDFVGVWLNNLGDFPFSFSMALFVALSCSTATILSFSDKRDEFSFFAVIIAALVGCILNLGIIPINSTNGILIYLLLMAFLFISPIILIITLTIDSIFVKANSKKTFKVTSKLIYTDIFILINIGCSFLVLLPLVCIYISCKIQNQKQYRIKYNLKNILSFLTVILILYCIASTTKLTPGLIIPIEYRNYIGFREYEYYYKRAITKLSECKQLKNHIGNIQIQGFAEGRHYEQTDFFAPGGEAGRFVLELVGDRGTAFVNGCYGDCLGEPEKLAVRVYTKSAIKNLTFSQICP
ncbi:hypothetical protein [Nostoc sp.]|uniref:hypothetical protein n=1 Tax=Nostoc sp. TaxID=1180 RepID=UPI002FF8EC0B